MVVFRVPYPEEPATRRDLFEKIASLVSRHGTYEGTPERGTFQGSTPIGGFAGSYRAIEGSGELEIALSKKPFLVTPHFLEKEVRKFLSAV
jgi:hypothetical protein